MAAAAPPFETNVFIPDVQVRTCRGVSIATASGGLYGKRPHVTSYAPRGVNKVLSPFVMPDLTVCASLRTVRQHFLWVSYALVITFTVGHRWAYPQSALGQPSCPSPAINKRVVSRRRLASSACTGRRSSFRHENAWLLGADHALRACALAVRA